MVKALRRDPPSSKHHTLHGSELVEFPVLLQNLCDAKRSGTLVVEGPRKLFLYLRLGALAAAFDGDPEFLAKALVKTRALTWDELAEFQRFTGSTPATLERLLSEQGRVTEPQLIKAHRFVIRQVLGEIVTWRESHTRLRDGEPTPELLAVNLPSDVVEVPTRPALMEAVYQLDEWPRIREAVPSERDVPALVGNPEIDAGPEGDVLRLADGRRDVRALVELARMTRFDAMGLLREHLEAGLLRFLDVGELQALVAGLRADGDEEQLARLYERLEELGAAGDEASRWLAEAYESRGDPIAAARRYRTLARGRMDDPDQAVALFKRALELCPEDGALQREVVEAFLDLGRDEDAALQAEVYVGWLREQGDPAFAIRAARPLLERLEEFEEMLVLEAELCLDVGNVAQAVSIYRRVADGRLASSEFNQEEKVDALERILELAPDDLQVRFALAQLLADLDPPRAVQELLGFTRLLEATQERPDERLVQAYEMLVRLDPQTEVRGKLVLAAMDCGLQAQAQRMLEDCLEGGGPISQELIPAYRQFLKLSKNSESHLLLAEALFRGGLVAQGVAELRVLAARALGSGNKKLALQAYTRALEQNPFERTIRMALSALLRGPEQRRARIENLRALAHVAQVEKNHDLAIRTLESLVEEAGDPSSRAQLTECYLRRGGQPAIDHLRTLIQESDRRRDAGLVQWALRQAKRLKAPPEFFDGLPPMRPSGRPGGRR